MYKKMALVLFAVICVLFVPIRVVSADTNHTHGVNLTVQDTEPMVYFVEAIAAQDPIEGALRTIDFEVRVTDGNTVGDISTVNATFYRAGETNRSDASCTLDTEFNTTHANYSCSIDLMYYDDDGSWTVYAFAYDSSNNDTNSSVSFTYNQLAAMIMAPNNITFGALLPGQIGVASTNDPIAMNNTGNQDFTEINSTALDLSGVTNSTEYIPAGNFSMNTADSSGGDLLLNNTAVTLTSGTLPRGVSSIEDIYFYIEEVPAVQAQAYNTAGLGEWVIEVA